MYFSWNLSRGISHIHRFGQRAWTHARGIGSYYKNWGDCSGVTRHPFHMYSLYRSDCLCISAHVYTEMHMNICVCVFICVYTSVSLPACMYMFYRHFSVFIHHCDTYHCDLPSWSREIKQLESYWGRENGLLLKIPRRRKSLSKWTRMKRDPPV